MIKTSATKRICKWPNDASHVPYARTQERNSTGSLSGLSRILRMVDAHTARLMKEFMGKRPMRPKAHKPSLIFKIIGGKQCFNILVAGSLSC